MTQSVFEIPFPRSSFYSLSYHLWSFHTHPLSFKVNFHFMCRGIQITFLIYQIQSMLTLRKPFSRLFVLFSRWYQSFYYIFTHLHFHVCGTLKNQHNLTMTVSFLYLTSIENVARVTTRAHACRHSKEKEVTDDSAEVADEFSSCDVMHVFKLFKHVLCKQAGWRVRGQMVCSWICNNINIK